MSFEPFPVWIPRCDGETTHGQCTTRLFLDEDGEIPQHDDQHGVDQESNEATEWHPVLYTRPATDRAAREDLRACGWLVLPGDRFLCPRHVAALEYLARAEIDGLPFPTHPDPDSDPLSAPLPGVDERPSDRPGGAW